MDRDRAGTAQSTATCAVAAVLLVSAGCGSDGEATAPEGTPEAGFVTQSAHVGSAERTVQAEAAEYIDTSDPQAWVDWGSYVVLATVTGEVEAPVAPVTGTVEDPLEVPSNRDLTLAVESIEWEHPGALQPLEPGQEIQVRFYDGWVEQDGETLAVTYTGQTRPEVGNTYLMTVAEGADDSPDGFTVLPGSVQPVQDDTLARAESEFDGQSPQQVGGALADLKPDPDTAPVAGENLQDRIIRVLNIYGD